MCIASIDVIIINRKSFVHGNRFSEHTSYNVHIIPINFTCVVTYI